MSAGPPITGSAWDTAPRAIPGLLRELLANRLWRLSWNDIVLRRTRSILTALSIAGGVAAVVAVLQATTATETQLAALHQKLSSHVTAEVVATDGGMFPAQNLQAIEKVPGVHSAIPTFRVFTSIAHGTEEIRGVTLGVDLNQFHQMREFKIVTGRGYASTDEICLEKGAARRLGIGVGDDVQLQSRKTPWKVAKTVVGLLEFQGVDALEESASSFLAVDLAAQLARATGNMTAVEVITERNADPDTVVEAIKKQLPADLAATKAASSADMSRPTEMLVNVSLNAAAALSLVAAIFIVINTFLISVAERQKQFALLRIVGATIEQIRASIYYEALTLGITGTLLGVVVGGIGSAFLASGLQTTFGLEMPPAPLRFYPILGGLMFGPVATLISVWYPARIACVLPPLDILRSANAPHRGVPLRKLAGFAVISLIVSLLMFALSRIAMISTLASILGMTLVLLAGVFCLPSLILPGSYLLYGLIRGRFSVESQLGRSQILDNFVRSSLTCVVLFVVTATSISIGSSQIELTHDIRSWLDRTVTADFLIRAGHPRIDMSETTAVSDDFETTLATIPGIAAIDRVTFLLVTVNGQSATLMARQFAEYQELPLDIRQGDVHRTRSELQAGEAVVGTALAHRLGIRPGDSVRVEASGLTQSVKIAGIVQDYVAGGLTILMDRAAVQRMFPIQQTHVYLIRANAGASGQVGQALDSAAHEQGLIFQSLVDFRTLVGTMIDGIANQLWLILVLALVIAGFAIVNTLTMNVIEQTKSIGVLRVVGMSRGQVFRMFVFQAFVLSLLALLPGILMGALISWLITISFQGMSEHDVRFAANPSFLGTYLALGLLIGLVAAAFPALRAGRLKPLEAIYEE